MDIIKREQDFNVSLDYLSENEFFDDENEYKFYMETILIRYISNYLSNEVVAVSYTHLDVYKRQPLHVSTSSSFQSLYSRFGSGQWIRYISR